MDDQTNTPKDSPTEGVAASTDNKDQPSDLEVVEQKAIEALTPIIQHITNVDADRKFDICMTAIRMTNNKSLVSVALEAALQIEDDPGRAEALVELINEINYLKQA